MTMKRYRIELDKSGKVVSCEKLTNEAKRAAYNLYCGRKKKLAKERLYAEGRCSCGRVNDRFDQGLKTCSVCEARAKVWKEASNNRKSKDPHVRDEQKRIESFTERSRDRKSEIRLETLVEIQKKWQTTRITKHFERYLEEEIQKCVQPRLRLVSSK
jgi:hypothetical protein